MSENEKETPMMKQYKEMKIKHSDSILFFRLGDFYEMFGDDALLASKILNITLTARNKGENRMPMCGVPYHAAENYIARLTRSGKKVAICEQVSDPKAPGLVQREVVRTITPGTTFDENILDRKQNNYLISVFAEKDCFGIAFCDVTTGNFRATELMGKDRLINEINRLRPRECVLEVESKQKNELKDLLSISSEIFFSEFENIKKPYRVLTDHFRTKNLEGFGLEKMPFAIQSAGTLLAYLKDTQQNDLSYINKITVYKPNDGMFLDDATIRNLDLFVTAGDNNQKGSLFWLLDDTATAMGARLLKDWILTPLLEINKIEKRLEAVAELDKKIAISDEIYDTLALIYDLERIMGRIGCLGGNGRDLYALKKGLQQIPNLKKILKKSDSELLRQCDSKLENCPELVDLLEKSIEETAPVSLREGNIIKKGFNSELDDLREISSKSRTIIASIEAAEIERTGINSLKVRYNKVFGYYIEIRNIHLKNVPINYIRKQTLVNAERFITPELKEYEEKVLSAQEKICELEFDLFQQIREKIVVEGQQILKNASIIGKIDVICSLARVARKNKYCRPGLAKNDEIIIENGRHPIIEAMMLENNFVANSTFFLNESRIKIITGPNMAGKSTYLRQTALIVLMAHIGSFVPASKAIITPVDRIFTRVGASDNLLRGQSTFMVEMQEAANILNNATSKSLIILDEIGRGTSTFDGVSIAWAIIEYLHNEVKAKTLFATHYHELISVADSLKHAENLSVAVSENDTGVIFLYKIINGGIDRSYGIEVAKLAGLPHEIISKSKEILLHLEEKVVHKAIIKRATSYKHAFNEDQLNLFLPDPANHPALLALRNLDVNRITPMEALQKINELQSHI